MKTKPVENSHMLRASKLVLRRQSIIKRPKKIQAKTLLLNKVYLDNK